MGCCFSKELSPNLLSERTSLLQTSVIESCSDKKVKKYSTVSERAVENHLEYDQSNRGEDFRSDASSSDPSVSLRSVDKRSSSVQDNVEVWDEFKDDSHNKPLGNFSKDSDIQAETETAVLNSVKRRIAENAVKRANWFCEVDLSHVDSAPPKPRYENATAPDTLIPIGCHARPTCTTDAISSKLFLTQEQNQEYGHTKSNINQKSDVLFTGKHPYDDLLDLDEKRSDFLTSDCSVKRRTQSFYSICSIDAEDLEVECDPPAMMLPAAFNHTDFLTNTKTKFFISTSLGNEALETLNRTTETPEGGNMLSEDLSAETLSMARMLPDVVDILLNVGSEENAVSGQPVSVPSEVSVTEKSETCGHRSHITGLHKTVDESIPDLLERKEKLGESMLDHMDTGCLCQILVNTNAEFVNLSKLEVSEMACEMYQSEPPEQEPKSVDNKDNNLNSYVDCREQQKPEPSTKVNLSVRSVTWHEHVSCSHVEPDSDSVQDFLRSEISSFSKITEDQPSSSLSSSLESKSDVKSRVFISESSSQDVDMLYLNANSWLSPGEDSIAELNESVCCHAEREGTHLEPRSESSSLQTSNSFTSDTSQGSSVVLKPQPFQTGLVDYPRFDACLLLTHHDAERKEISLGMEDVTCHISSTELSDVKPESEIADEHVERNENYVLVNSAAYDEPPGANLSLGKDFSENSMNLALIEQGFSQLPLVVASDADFSLNVKLLEDVLQNQEELKSRQKHMFPAAHQENFNINEDGCWLVENKMLIKAGCFDEHTLKGPNQISLSIGHVEAPVMELQNSRVRNFDVIIGRNNDEQVIHLFPEGSSENTIPLLYSSPHAKLPDTFESATLSKNSSQSKSAHIPPHSLLGKPDMQNSSDLSNQEPELTPVDVQDEQMISNAEQQLDINYRVSLGRTLRPLFEIGEPRNALAGHDHSDEGVECFVLSRRQGYQPVAGSHASDSTCDPETSAMCSVPIFCADNKAIPLPVEPDQVDRYASMPSYEIHFLGPNTLAIPEQVKSPQNLTSTNETERVLNMVSELLGKSEVSEDGDCSHFLSVWAAEPEVDSEWHYWLSEDKLMGQNTQEEVEADSDVDCDREQVFTVTYPYSLLGSDGSCVWDWQTAYSQPVRLHPCCVA